MFTPSDAQSILLFSPRRAATDNMVQLYRNLKRALEQRDDGAVIPNLPITSLQLANTSNSGSDSDDTIVGNSNRGRKLKRKAQFVHEGKLDDGKGVNGFKEVYTRGVSMFRA